jgi:hypothetical protein
MEVHEILLSAILPAIKSVSQLEIEMALSEVKERKGMEAYVNTVYGIYSGFAFLKETTIRTKTRVNDGILDLVLEAVMKSAMANNISLSEKKIIEQGM